MALSIHLRSIIQVAIKTILNDGLPEVYDKRIFDDKRSAIYDYVYDRL